MWRSERLFGEARGLSLFSLRLFTILKYCVTLIYIKVEDSLIKASKNYEKRCCN